MEKGIKKASKEYHRLLDKKSKLRNKYYDIIDESECESCDCYNSGNVRFLKDRFSRCIKCPNLERINCVCSEIDNCINEVDEFIKRYSKIVFDYFSDKKPVLVIRKSGKKISWDEAFGYDYYSLSNEDVISLIGLIEEEGKYEIYNN